MTKEYTTPLIPLNKGGSRGCYLKIIFEQSLHYFNRILGLTVDVSIKPVQKIQGYNNFYDFIIQLTIKINIPVFLLTIL
jgi:hypothetical protein